jgi:hypothetical protein
LETRSQIVIDHMKRSEIFTNMARVLKQQEYTDEQFRLLVKHLVPDPTPWKDDNGQFLPLEDRQWTHILDKRKAFKERWTVECDKFGSGVGGNRWLAYKAIQGAEQHDLGKGEATDERSFLRAIEGKTTLSDKALVTLRPNV